MTRVAKQLVVCAALGVITTYAVAWSITARTWMSVSVHWTNVAAARRPFMPVADTVASGGWNFGSISESGCAACISWSDQTERKAAPVGSLILGGQMVPISQQWDAIQHRGTPPPAWTIARREPDRSDPAHGVAYYHEFAAGWPLVAVRWTRTVNSSPSLTETDVFGGFRRPSFLSRASTSIVIPFWPIWLGFAVNTAAFASCWFLFLFGYGTVRRMFRRAAGSCAECGYDLRASPSGVCPECGNRKMVSA